MKLRPVAERDAALRRHLETNHIYDEATGELLNLRVLVPDPTPDKDDGEPEHDPPA